MYRLSKDEREMTMTQPVKFSFTDTMGRDYKGYWNGKVYGTKVYATLSKDTGSDIKISFDSESNLCTAGNTPPRIAKEAFAYLASKGIAPFSQYNFTTDGPYAY
jgi:hypothetical protein